MKKALNLLTLMPLLQHGQRIRMWVGYHKSIDMFEYSGEVLKWDNNAETIDILERDSLDQPYLTHTIVMSHYWVMSIEAGHNCFGKTELQIMLCDDRKELK